MGVASVSVSGAYAYDRAGFRGHGHGDGDGVRSSGWQMPTGAAPVPDVHGDCVFRRGAGEIRASRETIFVGQTVEVISQNLVPPTLSSQFRGRRTGKILAGVVPGARRDASGDQSPIPRPTLRRRTRGSTTADFHCVACAVGTADGESGHRGRRHRAGFNFDHRELDRRAHDHGQSSRNPTVSMLQRTRQMGHPVGTVSATDPDLGDAVSYSIAAGNDGGQRSRSTPAPAAITLLSIAGQRRHGHFAHRFLCSGEIDGS